MKQQEADSRHNEVRKQTRQKLDNMKNNDIECVMAEFAGIVGVDPRESVRIQKVREAKQKLDSQTSQY